MDESRYAAAPSRARVTGTVPETLPETGRATEQPDRSATQVLLQAERVADELREDAQRELEAARGEAARLRSEAQRLHDEADAWHQDATSDL